MRTGRHLQVEMLETRWNPSLVPLNPLPIAPITALVSDTTSALTTSLLSNPMTASGQSTALTSLAPVTSLLPQTTLHLDSMSLSVAGTDLKLGDISVTVGGKGLVDVGLGNTSLGVGNLIGVTLNKIEVALSGDGLSIVSNGAGTSVGGIGIQVGGGGVNVGTGGGGGGILDHPGDIIPLPGGDPIHHPGLGIPEAPTLPQGDRSGVPLFEFVKPAAWKGSDSGAEEASDLAAAALFRERSASSSPFGFHADDDAEPVRPLRVDFVSGTEDTAPAVGAKLSTADLNMSLQQADLLDQASAAQMGVDTALQQLLACLEQLARELALTLTQAGLLPWLLALLAAGAAAEIVRRDRQRAQAETEGVSVPGCSALV